MAARLNRNGTPKQSVSRNAPNWLGLVALTIGTLIVISHGAVTVTWPAYVCFAVAIVCFWLGRRR